MGHHPSKAHDVPRRAGRGFGLRPGLLVGRAAGRVVREDRPGTRGAKREDFCCGHDRMAAQPQAGWRADRRGAIAHRPGDGCGHRAGKRAAECGPQLPCDRRVHRALHRAVRHGLRHHACLHPDRRDQEHRPCHRGAGDCRGADGDRHRPCCRHPGSRVLQQAQCRQRTHPWRL
ncbi:UNVERIFIED_CONTAM: hypothetical protein NCL1_04831 [Trichonephila clavipes]